jgi:Phage endonuclease I
MIQLRIPNLDQLIIKQVYDWVGKLTSLGWGSRKQWAKDNPISKIARDYVEELYKSGYGMKVIAREIGLTYPVLRSMFKDYWEIVIIQGTDITYKKTKEFRKHKALVDPNNPFRNWLTTQKRTKTNHGVQGYYINRAGNKLWLRSTYEYIYCKWLDENNINYKYEDKSFRLSNGELYRPDFFLDDNIIVEIKGKFYSNRRYKADMLKEEYPNIKIIIVDDISGYTKNTYKKELQEWKCTRLLN